MTSALELIAINVKQAISTDIGTAQIKELENIMAHIGQKCMSSLGPNLFLSLFQTNGLVYLSIVSLPFTPMFIFMRVTTKVLIFNRQVLYKLL